MVWNLGFGSSLLDSETHGLSMISCSTTSIIFRVEECSVYLFHLLLSPTYFLNLHPCLHSPAYNCPIVLSLLSASFSRGFPGGLKSFLEPWRFKAERGHQEGPPQREEPMSLVGFWKIPSTLEEHLVYKKVPNTCVLNKILKHTHKDLDFYNFI